jgi:hypothetical protein
MRGLKRLSHRSWGSLRDRWIGHLPGIDFDTKYPEPTLWQLPDIDVPELDPAGTAEPPYVPGVREAIFREAVLLSRKFIYSGTILHKLSVSGKNTWTAVVAYEACFYGAKAFCYFLGFASCGRSSRMYIDAFHETERKVGKVRLKVCETLRFHRLDERLTHDVLWALTARLIDTTIFEDNLRSWQTLLKLTDWDGFSAFRNKVFYDGGFWPLQSDVATCDLAKVVHDPQIAAAALLEWTELSTPFASEYFATARLLRHLITGMIGSLAEISPALETEVLAFDSLRPTDEGPSGVSS